MKMSKKYAVSSDTRVGSELVSSFRDGQRMFSNKLNMIQKCKERLSGALENLLCKRYVSLSLPDQT